MMDEEGMLYTIIKFSFVTASLSGFFLIFSRSGFRSPFCLFLTKLLRFLNHTIASIHYLFRLSYNRVVSKGQIHEDV